MMRVGGPVQPVWDQVRVSGVRHGDVVAGVGVNDCALLSDVRTSVHSLLVDDGGVLSWYRLLILCTESHHQ